MLSKDRLKQTSEEKLTMWKWPIMCRAGR